MIHPFKDENYAFKKKLVEIKINSINQYCWLMHNVSRVVYDDIMRSFVKNYADLLLNSIESLKERFLGDIKGAVISASTDSISNVPLYFPLELFEILEKNQTLVHTIKQAKNLMLGKIFYEYELSVPEFSNQDFKAWTVQRLSLP
jgi:hypothetical protein